MTTTYYVDPFHGLEPGGSPGDHFSNPPVIYLPGHAQPFRVLFIWDWPTIVARNGKDTVAEFKALGMTAQGLIREPDGTEYRVRVFDDRCEVTTSPFRGEPFTPPAGKTATTKQPTKENDMTVLRRFHQEILGRYVGTDDADTIAQGLSECATFADTHAFLQWPDEDWSDEVERFMGLDIF